MKMSKKKPPKKRMPTLQEKYASKDGATQKYFARAQHWQLHFFTAQQAQKAVLALTKFNQNHQCFIPGTGAQRDGDMVRFSWSVPVTGKSLYGSFRRHCLSTLGPGGTAQPTDFFPTTPTESPNSRTSAIGEPINQHGYPALPEEFANVSLDSQSWWNLGQVFPTMEQHGFICLREFIPKFMVDTAFQQATTYFLGVLKSFDHGLAIDEGLTGIDKVKDLPSKVWEKRLLETVTIQFEPGPLGLEVEPETSQVNFIKPGGQASTKGVREGWVVSSATSFGCSRASQDLACFLQKACCTEHTEITFQPMQYYHPFALKQKWGVFKSRGFQNGLGLGKCTDAINFQGYPAIQETQLWMRNFIASLHQCLPGELCWQPDGVSFKAGCEYLF